MEFQNYNLKTITYNLAHMYCQVIPIVRLPRRFTFFDYRIPLHMDVQVGDLVRMSFKKREIFGIVRGLMNETNVHAHDLIDVAFSGFCTPKDVERIEFIARSIYSSPSTLAYSAFGKLKMRQKPLETIFSKSNATISAEMAARIGAAAKDQSKQVFMQACLEEEFALASLLRRKFENQILILVPRYHLIENLINQASLGPVQVLHGKTPIARREKIVRDWRRGDLQTLIGIRSAALLPANKLDAIHIIDAGSPEWSILDQDPRFDARPASALLATQHSAQLYTTGAIPILGMQGSQHIDVSRHVSVIDLKAQDEYSGTIFLSNSLKNAIEHTLQNQKSVLLSFNRKGVAKSLECRACGHIPYCGICGTIPEIKVDRLICPACSSQMQFPKTCPSCKSDKLSQRGIGNKRMKTLLQQAFPQAKIGIIDKDIQEEGDIILATEYYFTQRLKAFGEHYGLVAEMCFERLLGSHYTSAAEAAYKMHRLIGITKAHKATCFVQAFDASFAKRMLALDRFMQSELVIRKKYSLPPAKPRVLINGRPGDASTAGPKDKIEVQTIRYS